MCVDGQHVASSQLGIVIIIDMAINANNRRIKVYTIFEVAYQSTYSMEAHRNSSNSNFYLPKVQVFQRDLSKS